MIRKKNLKSIHLEEKPSIRLQGQILTPPKPCCFEKSETFVMLRVWLTFVKFGKIREDMGSVFGIRSNW